MKFVLMLQLYMNKQEAKIISIFKALCFSKVFHLRLEKYYYESEYALI